MCSSHSMQPISCLTYTSVNDCTLQRLDNIFLCRNVVHISRAAAETSDKALVAQKEQIHGVNELFLYPRDLFMRSLWNSG